MRSSHRIEEINEDHKTYTYPQTAALVAASRPWSLFSRHGWSKFGRRRHILSTPLLGGCGGGDDQAGVGGVVLGLATGSSVTLQNNHTDTLTLTSNGKLRFATTLAAQTPYIVTVSRQPLSQTCTVAVGSGQIVATNDVTNVSVSCVPSALAGWRSTKRPPVPQPSSSTLAPGTSHSSMAPSSP